jgi:hypothetical protein
MSDEELGQKPAFPFSYEHYVEGQHHVEVYQGVSKRFYAASNYVNVAHDWVKEMSINTCKKLLGLNKEDDWEASKHYPMLLIKIQYMLADELLKQENND